MFAQLLPLNVMGVTSPNQTIVKKQLLSSLFVQVDTQTEIAVWPEILVTNSGHKKDKSSYTKSG